MTPRLTHSSDSSGASSPSPSPSPLSTDVNPQLSPKDIRLPPSPPSDSDDDSYLERPRLARLQRTDSDAGITSRPVIHQLPFRPRNHSPSMTLARPHTSGGLSTMPLMQRAHSTPGLDSQGRFITPSWAIPRRPSSPLSAGRRRSPLRSSMDESYPVSWSGLNIEPNIPEHAELQLSSPTIEREFGQFSTLSAYTNTFPRSRRKSSSPLHPSASAPSLSANARAVSPHTIVSNSGGTSSPSHAQRFYTNEPFPTSFSSASSMPSTPSSLRSRSPSISSLETIEDTPDAEEAARQEEEEEAKQRADDSDGGESKRRASLELRGSSLRSNKERKRWSVCGAERRADFSLEPIEE